MVLNKINITNNKKGSTIVYIIFFLVVFLAMSAFAVDGTLVFTDRIKLQGITEMTALAAASEFTYDLDASASEIDSRVRETATSVFGKLKQDSLKYAQIVNASGINTKNDTDGKDDDIQISTDSKKVLIKTDFISKPFFLSFLGVSGIKLEAQACARSESLVITANYNGINWVTRSAAYLSDILSNVDASSTKDYKDTAILFSLGGFKTASFSSDTDSVDFSLISTNSNDKGLSLGPGGFVTIKLPAPIVDKEGPDLYIKEIKDAKEGYMVFAGLDNDPKNPYVSSENVGGKIYWKNISCSGVSAENNSSSNSNPWIYNVSTTGTLGNQDKFYGSGYFDLGDSCTGGLSMAKYIRIVDDNAEDGFVYNNNAYQKVMLYGEASTGTAGADISAVKLLNHVKLIPSTDFANN